MAGRNPFARIRLVYSRSSTTVKIVVLAALALSTLALLVLRYALLETKGQLEDKRAEAAALEESNRDLSQAISQQGTVQSVDIFEVQYRATHLHQQRISFYHRNFDGLSRK